MWRNKKAFSGNLYGIAKSCKVLRINVRKARWHFSGVVTDAGKLEKFCNSFLQKTWIFEKILLQIKWACVWKFLSAYLSLMFDYILYIYT